MSAAGPAQIPQPAPRPARPATERAGHLAPEVVEELGTEGWQGAPRGPPRHQPNRLPGQAVLPGLHQRRIVQAARPGRPRDCGGRAGGPTVADGPARRTQDPTALEMSARGAALPEGRERSSSVGTFRTSRSSWTSHARTSRRGDGVARDPTRRAPRPSRTARPWRHRARPRSTPSRSRRSVRGVVPTGR